MTPLPSPSLQRLAEELLSRQAELLDQLRSASVATDQGDTVHDLKDMAEEEIRRAVDNVTFTHVADELKQIAGALRRLEQGSYGICQDCGEPIDERRLLALPATPVCADCQRVRETGAEGPH